MLGRNNDKLLAWAHESSVMILLFCKVTSTASEFVIKNLVKLSLVLSKTKLFIYLKNFYFKNI